LVKSQTTNSVIIYVNTFATICCKTSYLCRIGEIKFPSHVAKRRHKECQSIVDKLKWKTILQSTEMDA